MSTSRLMIRRYNGDDNNVLAVDHEVALTNDYDVKFEFRSLCFLKGKSRTVSEIIKMEIYSKLDWKNWNKSFVKAICYH